MNARVRVRFAPSPTGPLHIGGVRTALFNYLFAKKHGGDFILRIEDTDQTRFVPGAEAYIVESLQWCGIPFDEGIGLEKGYGPYRQSERKDLYRQYVETLLQNDWAYVAFDSPESLETLRKSAEAEGKTFIYNHENRDQLDNALALDTDLVAKRIQQGENYVVRFKTPAHRKLTFTDIIRGEITVDTGLLDDKVLFKSDGMPTYHLANVVDDHLMEISHVIRGEEWLPSLALHVLLYEAFGWTQPAFAHLPLILKPTGNGKLSKRDGDKMGFPVFPLSWKDPNTGEVSSGYREKGYLPEAVVNMLAFLGWNPGTEQEIFNLSALVDAFSLENVHKAGAKFDPEKTKWFQHQYFIKQEDTVLVNEFQIVLERNNLSSAGLNLVKIVSLLKERAHFTEDLLQLGSYFFSPPATYDAKASKNWKPETNVLMQEVIKILENVNAFDSKNIENDIKTWLEATQTGFGKVMQPLRLCLVGSLQGPHLFDIMEVIGKQNTIERIQTAIKWFVTNNG
ncbi:MAG: glutamate--tRNA ligase [Flavobacteriaceae bacterium]|nr:glutamate--tRNA ligase [Flavobacteriaceae bacterium]